MIGEVKRCRNLSKDSHGHNFCRSSHVCYRQVCSSDIFETVLHLGAYIYTISGESQKGK